MQKTFFFKPTQVTVLHDNGDTMEFLAGIAYNEEFICGGCGATIPLEEISEVYLYKNWIPISEEIAGDCLREIDCK